MSNAEHQQNSNDNCPCQEVQKHTDHFGQKGGLERQQREQLDADRFRALSGTQRKSHFPPVTPRLYLSASGSFDPSPYCSKHNCSALLDSTAFRSGFENWETETDPNANSHSHKVKMITRNTKTLEDVNKPQQVKTPSPKWKLSPVTC